MRQTVVVHIYQFVRMSHIEPSRFIRDDFETIQKEITLVKQYGFPGTYALKYDALMDPRYQALFRDQLDECDELSVWWEITEPLCRRAGVPFRGKVSPVYDDRVDSAYCVGYEPEERKRLLDAYMADFHQVFGRYPKTIGAWVLDSVTLGYGAEQYGLLGGAICRDQLGTDGFTLWGGYPNGIYYPSRKNEFIPAQTRQEQLPPKVVRKGNTASLEPQKPITNYNFVSQDGRWKLNLTQNFIALSTVGYQRWEDFATRLDQPLAQFIQIYQPAYFERIGLRYVNAVSRQRLGLEGQLWDDLIQSQYIGILGEPDVEESEIAKCSLEVDTPLVGGYRMKLRTGPGLVGGGKTDKEVKFVLDADFSTAGKMTAEAVPEKLERMHRFAVCFFQGAITKELHEAMGPTPMAD